MDLHTIVNNAVAARAQNRGEAIAYGMAAREMRALADALEDAQDNASAAKVRELADQFRMYRDERTDTATVVTSRMDAAMRLLAGLE